MNSELIIDYLTEVPPYAEVYAQLDPVVHQWFQSNFDDLNDVQALAIPRIIQNKSTLVTAPTGSGKTLAAFLGIISELHRYEEENRLEQKIYALYISPLKALNNDIHKNLEIPLQGIQKHSGTKITAAIRTGDTTSQERQRMLRKPPHILITTPESLGLMLAAPKFKKNLRDINWLIVDEIHSIADNKRGTLLSLSLERLEYYLERPLTRIGLSATVEPLEQIAHYLMGNRKVELGIIDRGGQRDLEIEVITPVRDLVHAPYRAIESAHLDYLNGYIMENSTVLIFTNTRHMSERLVYDLIKTAGEEYGEKIAVHHGSLDKKVRLDVERRLKRGDMKAVFTSTSLEMGIDIGSIDLTVQLGSPKSVSSLLQRIGRSGHSQELTSMGKLLVYNRDDLLESTVIAKLAMEGKIDAIRIPEAPLDVLFQMIIGMAVEKKWDVNEAYNVVRLAYPFRNLSFEQFIGILEKAADPTGNEDSWKYGHIWYDADIKEFGKRKSARQAYLQNIGTIPDATTINVVLQGFRTTIGQIAEKFAEKLQERDIFILGGQSYEFIRSVGNKVIVKNALGKIPTIPSWGGEAQTRTWEVSEELSYLITQVDQMLEEGRDKALQWVGSEYPVGQREANAIVDYLAEQKGMAPLPHLHRIIVESYKDPAGAQNILVLSIMGLETNRALAQAIGSVLSTKLQQNIGMVSIDNGFLIRIPPGIDFDHSKLFEQLVPENIEQLIKDSLKETEMFRLRFRHCAGRALLILRRWGRREISISSQRNSARWLTKTLEDQHPIIMETFREILFDTYNTNQAISVVKGIRTGDIEVTALDEREIPSSMTHEILLNGEMDVVQMEDRRSLLLSLHQQVLTRLLPELSSIEHVLKEQDVDEYFRDKFSVGKHGKSYVILNFASYTQKFSDPLRSAHELIGLDNEEIDNLLNELEPVIRLPDGNYTTEQLLPYHGSVDPGIYEFLDREDPQIKQAHHLSQDISPEVGWEQLVLHLLEFSGPLDQEQIVEKLDCPSEKLSPVITRLKQRNEILAGRFTASRDQFMLISDREALINLQREDFRINEESLRDYRLLKMRLTDQSQNERMTILDYLLENGPARDPMELLARIPSFNWIDLRRLLTTRKVFFGRFLGRRLVFVHERDIKDFIRITRSNEGVKGINLEVLSLISEVPGITQKQLSKLITQPINAIQNAINFLEHELYIVRTGYELTLIHGGFPNPQYIALPTVETSRELYHDAVLRILRKCMRWYGPLTLNDFLRITRLPYPVVEQATTQLGEHVEQRTVFGTTYYGYQADFDVLEEIQLDEDARKKVLLLSPLDPFFYMTSGSFRRDQLPRQTRLTIIQGGMPKGQIEVAIPDKDVLQVINIQISKRNLQDFDLVQQVGIRLKDLGKRAYQTPAIYIEEINYLAANHQENRHVVTVLEEVGFQLHIDHLVVGTRSRHEFSIQDVVMTRQIFHKRSYETKYNTIEDLFEHHGIVPQENILEMINENVDRGKLLISHHLRSGMIHYHNQYYYRDDIFRALFSSQNEPIDDLVKPKTSKQLTKIWGLNQRETNDILNRYLDERRIELISPYSLIPEYRAISRSELSRSDRLKIMLEHIIRERGPISFVGLQQEISDYFEVSRPEILIILIELLENTIIQSASVRDNMDVKQIMYFTPGQYEILTDAAKQQYFDGWEIYKTSERIFEEFGVKDSHVVSHLGEPMATFNLNRNIDTAHISNITLFVENQVWEDKMFSQMIASIEQYIFKQGLQKITIEQIQGSYPHFWLELEKEHV